MHSIAVAGHLCLDFRPNVGETAELAPGRLINVGPLTVDLGGAVANTGGALIALGARVTPSAFVGDDELATLLASKLTAEGFSPPHLTVVPGASTSYSLVIERPGEDRTFWHHTGANEHFDGASIELGDAGILHVGYPSLLPRLLENDAELLVNLLERAKAAGVMTSVDLAVVDPSSPVGQLDWDRILRRISPYTDIISPSLDDLTSALRIDESYSPDLVNRLAQRFLDDGVSIVAISAGHRGMLLRTSAPGRMRSADLLAESHDPEWASRTVMVEPIHVEAPRTTNGAGDASSAGLLFAIVNGASPEEAAALATACSSAVIGGERPTAASITRIAPQLATLFAGI